MKTLLTIKQQDFVTDCPIVDSSAFRKRDTARAILLDNEGQVFLLNVSKHSYHKIPGGGLNEGEDTKQALDRELMEEIGCKAEILAELGAVIEYRDFEDGGLIQKSYCYFAKQIGEQFAPKLEEDELAEGIFEIKAKSIDDAISLLTHDKPDNLEGKFILKRDIAFLQAAQAQL